VPCPPDPAGDAGGTDRGGLAPNRRACSLPASDVAALERALVDWRAGDLAGRETACRLTFGLVSEAAHLTLGPALRIDSETGDVVGRVYARFVRRPPPASVGTADELVRYLYRSVINDLRDRHRARRRLKRDDRLAVELEEEGGSDWIPRPQPSPSEVAMGRERFARYKAALAELDPRQREAIVLGCHVGCASKEAAVEMGFPTPGSYRAFLARTLARVSLAMGDG
jgi:DNA-directed RNA polymerase specialized sigma24 family protein